MGQTQMHHFPLVGALENRAYGMHATNFREESRDEL